MLQVQYLYYFCRRKRGHLLWHTGSGKFRCTSRHTGSEISRKTLTSSSWLQSQPHVPGHKVTPRIQTSGWWYLQKSKCPEVSEFSIRLLEMISYPILSLISSHLHEIVLKIKGQSVSDIIPKVAKILGRSRKMLERKSNLQFIQTGKNVDIKRAITCNMCSCM